MKSRKMLNILVVLSLLLIVGAVQPVAAADPTDMSMWDMVGKLEGYTFVDLTHTFAPGIPRWPGFEDAVFSTVYDYDDDGFYAQEFVHVGQYGTHVDPPAHFHKGLNFADQIDLKEMVAPLVVLDVSTKVAENPDYQLTIDDVKAWEEKYGPIPEGAFVAMRSDWSKRFSDVDSFFNKDETGQAHYPGWTLDALKYLYEEKGILASGHEPPDTDAAVQQNDTGFAAESYILEQNHYQIELMNNLDKVPEAGAMVFATWPKPKDGSGFPARVFAIVPPYGEQNSFQLWDMVTELKSHDFVDLTHAFAPGIPRWPGFDDAVFKTVYDYDPDGFYAQEFTHVGQYGTHVDPPAHFHKATRTADEIDLKEMISPLVVLDVSAKVAENPDYQLTVDDVKAWEEKYGPVPQGAFVAMRSDWSKRFSDVDAFFNKDAEGQAHYPGWTMEALQYLYEVRGITASGHEPPDTDAAVQQNETGFAAESYILQKDHYQIELMNALDEVPEAGAMVVITWPKPKDGSGLPGPRFRDPALICERRASNITQGCPW